MGVLLPLDIQTKAPYYFSASVHVALVLVLIFSFPAMEKPIAVRADQPIFVELVSITDKTNLKPSKPSVIKKPKSKPTPPRKEAQEKPLEQVVAEVKQVPELPPEPLKAKEEEKINVIQAPRRKPLESPNRSQTKQVTEAKKQTDVEFNKLLKDLSSKTTSPKETLKENSQAKADVSKTSDSSYEPDQPLSLSEKDAIFQQISRNWNIPAGAVNIDHMQVLLDIFVSMDGTILDVKIKGGPGTDEPFYKIFVDSALRAVWKTEKLRNLPIEKYTQWQHIELNFDAKAVL